ncbi:MAG: PAS domain S-box protein [Bacteroidota bacterium]
MKGVGIDFKVVAEVFETNIDGVFAFDEDLNIVLWNKSMVNLSGLKKRQVVGRPVFEIMEPLQQTEEESCFYRTLAGESIISQSAFKTFSDEKDSFIFQASYSPVRDVEGSVSGGIVILRRIEKDYHLWDSQSSPAFSSLDFIEGIPLALGVFNPDGTLKIFNSAYAKLWGIDHKAGQYYSEYYNVFEDKRFKENGLLTYVKDGFNGKVIDIPKFTLDGRSAQTPQSYLEDHHKYIKGKILPVAEAGDTLKELVVVFTDLTEQKQIEDILSDVHLKFQKLTINLPGVIYECLVDNEGDMHYPFISQGCQEMFGFTPEELMRSPSLIEEAIHPEDKSNFLNTTRHSEEQGLPWEWEARILCEGEVKWIEGKSSPEKRQDGTVARYGIFLDITAKKEAERYYRQVEERLDLALDGAEMGLWDWDINNKKAVFNRRWAAIFGYEFGELEHSFDTWEKMIHPDDMEAMQQKLRDHFDNKTNFYEAEYRFLTKSGEWKWILDRGKVVERNEKGEPLRVSGTHLDINYRKVAEKQLKKSEERYRKLFEHSPMSIVVHLEGKILFANPQSAKLLSAETPYDLVGRSVFQLLHPAYRRKAQERMRRVTLGESVPVAEEKLIRLDGEEVDVEVVGIPFEYEGKIAVQVIARDITERKRTESIIKKNEKLFTQLFHNSPLGVVLLNDEHNVVQVNKGFEHIFGYAESEIIGKRLNNIIVPQGFGEEAVNINAITLNGQVGTFETVRLDKSGESVPVIIYGVPVRHEDKTIGIYGIYVDITERKKIEEELKTRNEELDNFVYKVSHDLRAPLSSILGLVNLAQHDRNDDDIRHYVGMIKDRVEQLDRFISDVLSHSKNLKIAVTNAEIDLQEVFDNCFADLNYLPNAHNIQKAVEVEGGKLHSDKWRINEIFRNLISNAIKYHDPAKATPYVKIKATIDANFARVTVEDNGIGIHEELMPKIFEMFYRATENSEGSGIGLYIVKNAIERIGGTLDIDSHAGIGTKFEIVLPNMPEN